MMNLIHIIDCYYWIWIQSAMGHFIFHLMKISVPLHSYAFIVCIPFMMNLIHIIDCYYWIWIQSAIHNERSLWLWGSNANVKYGKKIFATGNRFHLCLIISYIWLFFIYIPLTRYLWKGFVRYWQDNQPATNLTFNHQVMRLVWMTYQWRWETTTMILTTTICWHWTIWIDHYETLLFAINLNSIEFLRAIPDKTR